MAAISLIWVFLASACTGYGKLSLHRGLGKELTIRQLMDNWHDYEFHYAVVPGNDPIAILFDPIHDDNTLKADKWTEVEDQTTLKGLVLRINGPRLYDILGPKGDFFGYLVLGHRYPYSVRIFVKAVAPKTLYVFDPDFRDIAPP